MPNNRILLSKQRKELYESITSGETVIEVVGGKMNGYVGVCVGKSSYYSTRVNRIDNYFMITVWYKENKKQVGCNNIKLHNKEEEMMASNKVTIKGLFKNEEQEVLNVTNISFTRNDNDQPMVTLWADGKMSREIPFDWVVEMSPMMEGDE